LRREVRLLQIGRGIGEFVSRVPRWGDRRDVTVSIVGIANHPVLRQGLLRDSARTVLVELHGAIGTVGDGAQPSQTIVGHGRTAPALTARR
jgi:hypothetical protein